MIQIVGGKYRSRKIDTPDSFTTLPTKNMVRGAMFSALHEVSGDIVLDLFAGSGALGIEALSRGATHCTFVEKDQKAANIIAHNLSILKENNGVLLPFDDKKALERLKKEGRKFSLVLLDPPYAYKESYQYAVDYLIENDMLLDNPRFILEYEGEIPFDSSRFGFAREYKYGKSKFLYLKEMK